MKNYIDEIVKNAEDILYSETMLSTKKHLQHGNTSVYDHSVSVAVTSLYLADEYHVAVNRRSLIRGALLHDYFLYDWHDRPKEYRPHGFTHADTALKNAQRDFQINELEAEMIYCHMFPMNILRVPLHKESMILCIADKIVGSKETFGNFASLVKKVGGVIIGTVH